MTSPLRFVFWQPTLTDHYGYTLQALAELANSECSYCVTTDENAARKLQGWQKFSGAPSARSRRIVHLGDIGTILRVHRDDVHIFGSPFENFVMILVLAATLLRRMRVYLVSEPYSPVSTGYLDDSNATVYWLKGKLRPFLYKLYGLLIRKRVSGVFAISRLAVVQYRKMGVPASRVFPFGYFVPEHANTETIVSPAGRDLRVVFVGSLINRKGLQDLIEATRNVRGEDVSITLDVYGAGEPRRYNFDESVVRYCGVIPFGETSQIIAGYDLLVLPSHFDGWGVVVNESLMAGVPVLASDAVGAAGVLQKWRCGAVFKARDILSLSHQLKAIALNRHWLDNMKGATFAAAATLTPESGARYMFDRISARDGEPDITACPWYHC